MYDRALNSSEEAADFDDLIDLQALLDDDTFMPTASWVKIFVVLWCAIIIHRLCQKTKIQV